MTRRVPVCIASSVIAGLMFCASAWSAPLLLRNPALSQDRIAFLFGGDIWLIPRSGGEARRLTSIAAVSEGPYFSPDGSRIAYSARERGLTDVYVINSDGGVPRRLTWEPTGNLAVGWTPDGKDVLFSSGHASKSVYPRLFRVRADGVGPAEVLPLPSADWGSYSSDGNILAYVPVRQWQSAWKHYRGGQTTPVWLVNMKTLDLEKVPRENSNDSYPVWVGATVYFLSDRNGAVSLFKYDAKNKQVQPVIENHGLDLKTLNAGPEGLVYEQFGSLHLYDVRTGQEHAVAVTIGGDLPRLAPHLAAVPAKAAENISLSPTGARVVAEARGDVFTLPVEKGDIRNLTKTPGSAERDPSWSPDGKSIAYFSDASGEYQLYIRDQDGLQPPTVIDLGPDPSFFYSPRWSPDSKHIAFTDKHLRIWYVDAAGGKPVKIDTGLRGGFGAITQLSWSSDSQWIAYTRDLENELHAVFFYSLAARTSTQITDGMSNAANPVFDPNGKYLYFTASTNNGPSDAGIDLSSIDRATNSGVYVVVLSRSGASPVPPESDDENKKKDEDSKKIEKPADEKTDEKKKPDAKPKPTVIDLADIGNRILSLPIPTRNYIDLSVGKTGVLFLAEGTPVGRASSDSGPPVRALWRFTTPNRGNAQRPELIQGLLRRRETVLCARRQVVSGADFRIEDRCGGFRPRQTGEQRRNDGCRRSAQRLETDVSRDLAPAARFSLRPASAWSRSGEDSSQVRAVPGRCRVARRVHLLMRRDAGRNPGRSHVRATTAYAAGWPHTWIARRRLFHRLQPLSVRENLQWTELDPLAVRAADAARDQHCRRRLLAGRQWA
jgi:tricorn protease